MENKPQLWSDAEIEAFLSVVADDHAQRQRDGAARTCEENYSLVSERMAALGYNRTLEQCREKLEHMTSDYRAIKDLHVQSGSNRSTWKWFDRMESMYGHNPDGRESGLDFDTAPTGTMDDSIISTSNASSPIPTEQSISLSPVSSIQASPTPSPIPSTASTASMSEAPDRSSTGKRKRGQSQMDALMARFEEQEDRIIKQRREVMNLLLAEARETRQQEAALRRQEMANAAKFDQSFLSVLGDLVKVLSKRGQ